MEDCDECWWETWREKINERKGRENGIREIERKKKKRESWWERMKESWQEIMDEKNSTRDEYKDNEKRNLMKKNGREC